MSDFDDDFDNFDDNNFDDFNQKGSLKEVWQNNPLIKIFVIIAGIVLVVSAIFIFSGSGDEQESRVGAGLDQSNALGGEVSQTYTEAIEDVNRQRLETAVQTGSSTIPMMVNPEEQELLSGNEDLPPFQEFDPLQTFRAAVAPPQQEESAFTEPEPTLVAPEQIFTPQQIAAPAAPAPSPEAIQALAQAMSQAAGNILGNHDPSIPRLTQVTPENFLNPATSFNENGNQIGGTQLVDTNGDGIPDTPLNAGFDNTFDDTPIEDVIVETILIPSGTINYAQILIEANSDVPGPVLAQLMSGPLKGARLIGAFTVRNKVLVLSFNSIVVDGINQPVNAVALDPNTTIPGIATEVDNRYLTRVILPAAARFLEGVGSAIAQDSETTVTVSGDTVIEEQEALDLEQEIGRGVEEAFTEIAEFMEDEADDIEVLVRVARGTPIGVFFTEPVLELQ